MEWKSWNSVAFDERQNLPSLSGIYVVADSNSYVWYVGQASNLNTRWLGKNHHRYPQLIRTNRKLGHRIYWKYCSLENLDEMERFYIHEFQPELNGCQVKTYLPKEPKTDREIKRLLKVLNKNTFLFPDIRSVVAGEYHDENNIKCVMIIINSNDFRLIYNSSKKRHAKRVRESWIDFSSCCGRDSLTHNPYWVPAYLNQGVRYEFIECFEIIEYLEASPEDRGELITSVEFLGVLVKALKSLEFVDILGLNEECNFRMNGRINLTPVAYLKYRKNLVKFLS